MRIENLRGVSEVRFRKKLDSFTLETSKIQLIRNFLRNGRLRVNLTMLTGVPVFGWSATGAFLSLGAFPE